MHSAIRKTLAHPRTGAPLEPLGFRKDGRAIWPMLGAGPEEDAAAAQAATDAKAAEDKAAADAKAAAEAKADEKPAWYAAMSDEAKAEYDKIKSESRKHEDRSKDHKIKLTAAEQELEKLRQASLSDQEKAVEAAQKAGEEAAARRMAPQLIEANFRAQLAEKQVKFTDEHAALIDSFDSSKFLDDEGKVDAAKIAKVVATIGAPGQPKRDAPGVEGLGRFRAGSGPVNSVEAGAELFAQRHKAAAAAGGQRDWTK